MITGEAGAGTSFGAFMRSIGGNLTPANVMTVPDTDDEKKGNFFNILPVIPALMVGADRSSRRKRGDSEHPTLLPAKSGVQPVLDDILQDLQLNDLLTQGGYDMVALIGGGEETAADVAVLDSIAFEEALALSGSQGVPSNDGEFRVMFLYEDELGEVHPFAVIVDSEGQITTMHGEEGIAEQTLLEVIAGGSNPLARLGNVSMVQREIFNLDA